MTIDVWIKQATEALQISGDTTARLDALVLLADELRQDKSWVLAHPEHTLQIEQLNILSTKLVQRAKHIPLAYIRGFAEFYCREFKVNEHVLVPRPESESMIEVLKTLDLDYHQFTIIDVGTGSGCLAITAKLEHPNAQVCAIDINKNCVDLTEQNAAILGADINVVRGDLLNSLPSSIFNLQSLVILANLPYVPIGFPINEAATHEPKLALFSGEDGLVHYRRLFTEAPLLKIVPEAIITEALSTQHDELAGIAKDHGFVCKGQLGLAQLFALR